MVHADGDGIRYVQGFLCGGLTPRRAGTSRTSISTSTSTSTRHATRQLPVWIEIGATAVAWWLLWHVDHAVNHGGEQVR
jgi:hypothetical protein